HDHTLALHSVPTRRSSDLGANVVESIMRCRREQGPYTDFYDFLRKVDAVVCNKKTIESLIKAGAFDSLGHSRRGLLAVHAEAIRSEEHTSELQSRENLVCR